MNGESRLVKGLEAFANIALVVLCVVVGTRFLSQPASPAKSERPTYKVGEKIQVERVDFAATRKTVLLVVRKGCHFCEASMPFYRALGDMRRSSTGVRIIALTSDDVQTGKADFADHNVTLDDVVHVSFATLKITGTPTAIVVDSYGRVTNVWPGQLEPSKQKALEAVVASSH